jgi:hypothetical protein
VSVHPDLQIVVAMLAWVTAGLSAPGVHAASGSAPLSRHSAVFVLGAGKTLVVTVAGADRTVEVGALIFVLVALPAHPTSVTIAIAITETRRIGRPPPRSPGG